MAFKHWWTDGSEIGVALAKGTFHLIEGKKAPILNPQPEIVFEDLFFGDPARSSLRYEQDIVPVKPKTDLTLNAIARTPEGKALAHWPVGLEIPGRLAYGFRVTGPRFWEKGRLKGWHLGDYEPITELPIRYEYAYGGLVEEEEGETLHHHNPVGRGLLTESLKAGSEPIPAPQIGELGELMAGLEDEMLVCGFGPIAKSWLPRRSFAGTFDATWERERHPLMPEDYDIAYWNGAPGPLQLSPFLRGDEEIILTGTRHQIEPCAFKLPGAGLSVKVIRSGRTTAQTKMNLDTLHLDVSSPDPKDHTLTLLWRLLIRDPDEVEAIEVFATPLEEKT